MELTTCPACRKEFSVRAYRLKSDRLHPPCCSCKCARAMLKALGYKPWNSVKPHRLEKARALYCNKLLTIETIAEKVGVKRSTIFSWAKIHGWKRFPRSTGARTAYRKSAQTKLGRKLLAYEQVHHVNGDILDNRPENIHVYKDAKCHSEGHKSLEKCALLLLERGFVKFNDQSGLYELSGFFVSSCS